MQILAFSLTIFSYFILEILHMSFLETYFLKNSKNSFAIYVFIQPSLCESLLALRKDI